MSTIINRTYNIPPQGVNACCQNEECYTILVLPPGPYSTSNWMYRELLDNYPGVTFVSDSNLDLGDWSPQEYALYSETTVPPNRTRTFQITKALDMLAYDGTLHVQCPVGVFKTSNTSIQRVLAYVALTNPNVTLLTDVATT